MKAYARVDHQQKQIGFLDRLQHLTLDLDIHRNPWIVGETTGIDQPDLPPVPIGSREVAVARGAGLLTDDRVVFADDPVKQCRLPDVGSAYESYDREVHTAATGVSDSSTSMKS